MPAVTDQYEAFPYPARDPADEKKRLVVGSPSHPLEVDHFVYGGRRDWSRPLRALFAGGGTGDGLIQMAQTLKAAGRAYDFVYLDLSSASREIAEARARVRGLGDIRFVTGDLLTAPELGKFDYIDCCGVLHHLPDPVAGFAALAQAIAPGGGLGFMVYAPYGRSGVYPLQQAFNGLYGDLQPTEKLAAAKAVFANVPSGHPFRRNPHLGDHETDDAGFFDLLLHSQDRAFDVAGLVDALAKAGLELIDFSVPGRYDLARFAPVPEGADRAAEMALAEKLDGTIKTHVGYAAPQGAARRAASGRDMGLVLHIRGVDPRKLAGLIRQKGRVAVIQGHEKIALKVPRSSAPLVAKVDGRRSLADIAAGSGLDPVHFGGIWQPLDRALTRWGQLWYSGLLAQPAGRP